ncbi:MAG TPA: hypothetical protein VMH81_28940 [Bryobacteraceae bacterium]|nr:hypothetical protein [Bryobacteraceae bacterium]
MQLSVRALAITSALLWGGCLLVVGLINLAAPAYGADFLRGMGSVYPGFYHSRTIGSVLLGTIYGLIDGAVGGAIFGWLYNIFTTRKQNSGTVRLNKAA